MLKYINVIFLYSAIAQEPGSKLAWDHIVV